MQFYATIEILSGIAGLNSRYFQVNLSEIHTNIVIMNLDPKISPKFAQKRLFTVYATDPVKVSVQCSARDDWIRFVTCWEVSDEATKMAMEKIVFVLTEIEREIQDPGCGTQKLDLAYLQTQAAIEAQNKKSKL
ncbi:hypothetical protein HUJ04_007943 [Dendroctonus ponderosae]|nr:hypothetical protein HUJ04_007943 [Dendroctonus ponderosae]